MLIPLFLILIISNIFNPFIISYSFNPLPHATVSIYDYDYNLLEYGNSDENGYFLTYSYFHEGDEIYVEILYDNNRTISEIQIPYIDFEDYIEITIWFNETHGIILIVYIEHWICGTPYINDYYEPFIASLFGLALLLILVTAKLNRKIKDRRIKNETG